MPGASPCQGKAAPSLETRSNWWFFHADHHRAQDRFGSCAFAGIQADARGISAWKAKVDDTSG